MNPSLLRHVLTAAGSLLVFVGLGRFSGLTELLSNNVDAVWAAASTLIGLGTTVWGFFKGKEK